MSNLEERIKQQQLLPERIEQVDALLERRAKMLENRIENAETPEDDRRITRLQGRIDRANRIRDELTGQLASSDLAPLKDEFSINTRVDNERGMGWFEITITNSPYDNTYVPNDPLIVGYSGCHKNPVNASSRCTHSRRTLANGDYWREGLTGTQVLMAGSSIMTRIFNDYEPSFIGVGRDKKYHTSNLNHIDWLFTEV